MSTKGFASTAARTLLEGLQDVRFLVLHDFDKAGFGILGTLKRDTRRYQFSRLADIVDLGIRLEDVESEGLQPEAVFYQSNPESNLRKNGATQAEIDYLGGQRVELNEFSSDHFIEWLERKLVAHGVKKVIPNEAILTTAYRHAQYIRFMNAHLEELREEAKKIADEASIPEDLAQRVEAHLAQEPSDAWDSGHSRNCQPGRPD